MTFLEFKRLSWLKIDSNSYDIYILPTKNTILGWLKYKDIDESDNLIEKVKQMSIDEKLYWEFVTIGGDTYLDILASNQNPADYYDCEVLSFDLQNFKNPVLFLLLDI